MKAAQEGSHEIDEGENLLAHRERDALAAFNSLLRSGDLQKAKEFCESILEQTPLDPLFNYHLGNLENLLGNYESAKKAFLRSHQYSRRPNALTLFNIGYVCFRLDEFHISINAYMKCLTVLRQEEEELEAANAFQDEIPLERVYQNLGIAQSCLACTYLETEPEKARLYFRDALATFDKVVTMVSIEARAQSPVYGPAFVNTLQALENLIELQDPEAVSLQARLKDLIDVGLNSPDLQSEQRDIQAILWKMHQANGIEVPIEEAINKEIRLKLDTAAQIETQLQTILKWHQEPFDWPALFAEHNAFIREVYEQAPMHAAESHTSQEEGSDSSENNREEKSPTLKRHRKNGGHSTPELADAEEVQEDPGPVDLAQLREKNKVERLNEEITATLVGNHSFPYAFDIMLSSPEFLRLHGWYRFEMDRLPHLIHESYTFFHQRALFYNERLVSGCLKKLDLAGRRISQNNYLHALEIITEAMVTMANLCPDFRPRFICDLSRPEDPEIQIKRRKDFILIATLHIHHFYYKAQLILGLVHALMNQDARAIAAFDQCYAHIDALEDILKAPQHTEILRLIKDTNKNLKFSSLSKAAHDCERKIPESLRVRIKCLENYLQQDVLRITVCNSTIPFPYDMFKEGIAGVNQQLNIPDQANFSDHVLSVVYLMPDGTPQVNSISFNHAGVVFDLFNMANKSGMKFNDAKNIIVNKVNYGKKLFDALDESKRKLPSLAFMRHVEIRTSFDDREHKHSEQVYYFALDRLSPDDLIRRWVQDSNGKFTPDCTVIGVLSNMKSLKTGCPNCKASAIATQNPAPDDKSAFLNRLHSALISGGYRVEPVEAGKPKLKMVTRIRAYIRDQHANTHGLHENPLERNMASQENLAIFEKLESSTCVSGYRSGIY